MIAVRSSHSYKYPLFEVKQEVIDHDFDVTSTTIGIDPGTAHFGMAILAPDHQAILNEVKMKRDRTMMERIRRINEVLVHLTYFLPIDVELNVIIEAAAFSDRFRQAELAEQRAAVALWMTRHFRAEVFCFPPSEIYKKVFGSGKARAWKVWKELPHNAASALAVAIYPLYEKEATI